MPRDCEAAVGYVAKTVQILPQASGPILRFAQVGGLRL